jgi:hypothetical protein
LSRARVGQSAWPDPPTCSTVGLNTPTRAASTARVSSPTEHSRLTTVPITRDSGVISSCPVYVLDPAQPLCGGAWVALQRSINAMADSESPGSASVKALTVHLREARSLDSWVAHSNASMEHAQALRQLRQYRRVGGIAMSRRSEITPYLNDLVLLSSRRSAE